MVRSRKVAESFLGSTFHLSVSKLSIELMKSLYELFNPQLVEQLMWVPRFVSEAVINLSSIEDYLIKLWNNLYFMDCKAATSRG